MADARLDAAMAERGLARSRTHAARLIADGLVSVDGRGVVKASLRVTEISSISLADSDEYVSRGAHKLIGALDAFGVDPTGRVALDVGASTGGFTQVLLERGASRVIAIDVGHAQLATSIRFDQRVIVGEGINARFLTLEMLTELIAASPNGASSAGGPSSVDLVVADLSFISLTTVLPALVETVGVDADFVLLVKPQFEVGRTGIREGIVRNAALRTDAVNAVLWAAFDLGLSTAGVIPSPIVGTNGNHEYLIHLTGRRGSDPSEWSSRVTAVTTTAPAQVPTSATPLIDDRTDGETPR